MRLAFRQGEMDGLCGLYALVNAIALLAHHRLSANDISELFRELIRALYRRNVRKRSKDSTPLEFIWDGTSVRDISLLMETSRAFLVERGLDLTWSRPLQGKRKPTSLQQYWDRLRSAFDECSGRCVAIIDYNFDGEDSEVGHWTCVVKVTDKAMKLSDSSLSLHCRKGLMRKSRCTIGTRTVRRPYTLFAHNVYLLQITPNESF